MHVLTFITKLKVNQLDTILITEDDGAVSGQGQNLALHYDVDLDKDVDTRYCKTALVKAVLGSISILRCATTTLMCKAKHL